MTSEKLLSLKNMFQLVYIFYLVKYILIKFKKNLSEIQDLIEMRKKQLFKNAFNIASSLRIIGLFDKISMSMSSTLERCYSQKGVVVYK